jgi:hypothetical protein
MDTGATRSGLLTPALFLLNLALQGADFLMTYLGCRAGIGEGNVLVRHAMDCFGLTPGLALAKLIALAFLGYLWVVRDNRLVTPALTVTASAYIVLAIVPWSIALLSLA